MGFARPHDANRRARGHLPGVALSRRRAGHDRRRDHQAGVGNPGRKMVAGTTVEVVRVTDSHADALAEFHRAVWDPSATPDRVRRARAAAQLNPVAPGEDVPTFLFL